MPSYLDIKMKIEQMIASGELKVGQKLPSEYQMAKYFGVSRDTFREARKCLELDRRLVVRRGIGTFVVQPPPNIVHGLEFMHSIGELIRYAGLNEGERQESVRLMPCSGLWAEKLGICAGDPVYVLKRIRTASGAPVANSINVLPQSVVGDVFTRVPFSGSLLAYLRQNCSMHILSANTEIMAAHPGDACVQALKVSEATTVLLLKSMNYDQFNRTVMYSLDYLRNDIFSFWLRRQRKE